MEECRSGVFDDVVAAYRTFQSVAITGLFDEELVSVLPKSLKFIAHNGKEAISAFWRKEAWKLHADMK